jgi:hypothetical protein
MLQALPLDDFFGQPDIKFIVIVKMSEWFAGVAEGREAIVATRQRPLFDAQFCKSHNQLVAQCSHLQHPGRGTKNANGLAYLQWSG